MDRELSDDTIKFFNDVIDTTTLEQYIKFEFRDNNKLKGARITAITKPKGLWKKELEDENSESGNNKEIIYIEINEEIFDQLDEPLKRLIADDCLTEISWDMNGDKLVTTKPDIITYTGVMNKYGPEEILRLSLSIQSAHSVKKEKDAQDKADAKGNKIKNQ